MSRAVQSPVWICFLDEDLNNTARLQKGPWPLWAVITSTISPDSTFIIGHLPYGHGICSCATGCPVRYGVIRTYERISSSTWKAGASLVSMAKDSPATSERQLGLKTSHFGQLKLLVSHFVPCQKGGKWRLVCGFECLRQFQGTRGELDGEVPYRLPIVHLYSMISLNWSSWFWFRRSIVQ